MLLLQIMVDSWRIFHLYWWIWLFKLLIKLRFLSSSFNLLTISWIRSYPLLMIWNCSFIILSKFYLASHIFKSICRYYIFLWSIVFINCFCLISGYTLFVKLKSIHITLRWFFSGFTSQHYRLKHRFII